MQPTQEQALQSRGEKKSRKGVCSVCVSAHPLCIYLSSVLSGALPCCVTASLYCAECGVCAA